MGQAQPTQMGQSPETQQKNTKSTQHQQSNQSHEIQESNSENAQQIIQNTNQNQNQQEELQNIDEEEIQNDKDIENIWLTRIFEIFTNTQQIYGKQVDFIPQDQQLTVDILIEQVYYQFLTSSQFTEQEKLEFLIKSLISLSDFEDQDGLVKLAEGKIKKDKYLKILNHIQDQLLTCTLYPDAFEWQNIDEDPNIFDDIKNYRAEIVFNSLIYSNNLVKAQKALKSLFDYLETSASEDDSFKFIELMLKRELRSYKRLSFDNIQLQIHSLTLLQNLAQYQKLMDNLLLNSWAFGKYDQISTGNHFQQRTLLGLLLTLSTFPTDGHQWKNYFSDDKEQMKDQMCSLRTKIFKIIEDLCVLFETIYNSSEKLRLKLFELFQKIIKLNLNLEKQLNVQLQKLSSSPGLVFNFLFILTYLFNQFINSQAKIQEFLKKIDLNVLSYCQKHPFFSSLYQNVDLLAPELTPFIEPEEYITVIDPITTLFLLTQRMTHVVATSLEQFYISTILQELKELPPEAIYAQAYSKILKQKVSYDLQILHPKSIQYNMQFLSFANQLALSLIDQNLNPIYPYGQLPSIFLIDTQIFFSIYSFNDEVINHSLELQKCLEFAAISMNKKLIANPHLRIRSISLFQIIDEKKGSILSREVRQTWNQSTQVNILFYSKNLQTYLIDGILQSFVDTEKVAEENQFFQKLHIRFKFCLVMRYLFQEHKDHYRKCLIDGYNDKQEKYLHFSNHFLSDLIYLTEECFQSIKNIKKIFEEQVQFFLGHQYHKFLKEFIIKSQYFYEYLRTLEVVTSVQPSIFLIDEIREKLANYLNYILDKINGKQSNECQVQILQEKNIDRLFILEYLMKIYMNLSQNLQFLCDVVKDERCFSVDLFKQTQNQLQKIINCENKQRSLQDLINQLEEENYKQKVINENPDEIPEEFVDPLCFSLMRDPVKLPHSNVIVDRLTIKKHLLNQSIDPFDRTPLKLEMVIEQKELKIKIEQYLEKNLEKQKNKQKFIQEQK
ncbi:unnamed protein product [Paramecium sonneborni]|uniref:RING-type E3 ubiquitin transferase n=1 Tax=Paramecium sonneborni TaxID=65129 RepID=A0A8S1QPW9_9CILI|nr:unnamed protein product [Paramecium sonneborni]